MIKLSVSIRCLCISRACEVLTSMHTMHTCNYDALSFLRVVFQPLLSRLCFPGRLQPSVAALSVGCVERFACFHTEWIFNNEWVSSILCKKLVWLGKIYLYLHNTFLIQKLDYFFIGYPVLKRENIECTHCVSLKHPLLSNFQFPPPICFWYPIRVRFRFLLQKNVWG